MEKQDFDDLLESIDQARRFARGEEVPGLRYHPAPQEDARAIRKATGLSQPAFAAQIGVSIATLRNWEQRRRYPDGPARVLLALLAKDPGIVKRTLSEAEIDPENPEWTEADFAAAQGPEALPPALLAAFPRTKVGARASRRGSTGR